MQIYLILHVEKKNVIWINHPFFLWTQPCVDSLTKSLGQAVHLLTVDVGLVPNKIVRETGGRWEPLPEEAALHGHHEMHLHQAERDDRVAQRDPQDGLITRCAAAQISQAQICPWNAHFLLKSLCKTRWHLYAVPKVIKAPTKVVRMDKLRECNLLRVHLALRQTLTAGMRIGPDNKTWINLFCLCALAQ